VIVIHSCLHRITCASCLVVFPALFVASAPALLVSSVTKPKKPSSKKTSRDKKSSAGNLAPHRHRPSTIAPASHRIASHRLCTGTGSAWLASWHRHGKRAFQANVSNKRLLCLACVRACVRACACACVWAGAGVRARGCVNISIGNQPKQKFPKWRRYHPSEKIAQIAKFLDTAPTNAKTRA